MKWTVEEVRERIKEKYSKEIAKTFKGKFSKSFSYLLEKIAGIIVSRGELVVKPSKLQRKNSVMVFATLHTLINKTASPL